MPVVFKNSGKETAWKLALVFGVSKGTLTTFEAVGGKLSMSGPSSLCFEPPFGAKTSVSIPGSVITLAKAGVLHLSGLNKYKDLITAEIDSVIKEYTLKSGLTAGVPLTKNVIPDAVIPPEAVLNIMKETQPKPVPKAAASKLTLGQAVPGTNLNSTYHIVAIYPDMYVAARLKSTILSIRAVGSVAKYKKGLEDASLTDKDGHYSQHFTVNEDKGLASKTLGAVLSCLGVKKALEFGGFEYLP